MCFENKIIFSQAKKTVMLIVSWCLLVPLSHVTFMEMSYYYLNRNIELGSFLVLILFFVYIVFKMKWFDFKMQWAFIWVLFSLLYLENIIMLYLFKNDALVDAAIVYPMISCGIFFIFHLSRKIYFNRAIRAFFSWDQFPIAKIHPCLLAKVSVRLYQHIVLYAVVVMWAGG